LANHSRKKANKLRAIEDGARQLQAKDRQIEEKFHKIVNLRNELNTLALEARSSKSFKGKQGPGQGEPRQQSMDCFTLL
jgi:hypothetical protein